MSSYNLIGRRNITRDMLLSQLLWLPPHSKAYNLAGLTPWHPSWPPCKLYGTCGGITRSRRRCGGSLSTGSKGLVAMTSPSLSHALVGGLPHQALRLICPHLTPALTVFGTALWPRQWWRNFTTLFRRHPLYRVPMCGCLGLHPGLSSILASGPSSAWPLFMQWSLAGSAFGRQFGLLNGAARPIHLQRQRTWWWPCQRGRRPGCGPSCRTS